MDYYFLFLFQKVEHISESFPEPLYDVIGDWVGATENFGNQESYIMTWWCYPETYIGLAILQRELRTPKVNKRAFIAIFLKVFSYFGF